MILPVFIYLAVTLSILAGTYLAGHYLFPDKRQVRRRLREFHEPEETSSPTRLYKRPDQLNLDSKQMPVAVPRPPGGWKGWRLAFENALGQADLPWKFYHPLVLAVLLAGVFAAAAYWLGGPLLGLLGSVCGLMAPFLFVRWRRRQRQEMFLRQLPAAFDLMARVIRAGQSVPQALQAVVEAFEDPLASEFAQCQTHLGLGLRPEITFRDMAQRCGLMEMRIFVMALLIQQQTGGNLSEVLERLSGMTRARLKLRSQVKTLTAEGRMQGWTLVVLPFVVFAAMMMVNRQYAEQLLENTSLLAVCFAGLITGVLWIRHIVHFEY